MSNDPSNPAGVILVPVPVPVPVAVQQDGSGQGDGGAALPTYATVADLLEKKNGSGLRLAGWTVARMLMIAPPLLVVGVPAKQAFAGAALSSILISLFTLERIKHAGIAHGVPSAVIGREPYRGRGHYR